VDGRPAGRALQAIQRTDGQSLQSDKAFPDGRKDSKVDLLSLPGDLFSFPSESAIDWVSQKLSEAGVPYQYVAGNHDWHYEGMEGSLTDLRNQWIDRRLKPLYQGEHPLMTVKEIGGVRFVALDNSTYEILPEQLTFFREQVKSGKPLVLFVHIPLYAPGRSVGFGCGHPKWGWDADENYKLERRPRWPKAGHTETTLSFHKEVFAAPNMLGIFCGHTHKQSLDVINGVPQFVTDANATGAFMQIDLLPEIR
jgi:predicted phosphodiesterase